MIKIPEGSILDALLICIESRSTLEDEHIIYTLSNGYEVEVTGPIATNAVFKVKVYRHKELLSIYDRVHKEQVLTHLELAASHK